MKTKSRLVLAMVVTGAATVACAETRFASFTFENDFFAGTDKHYTNGAQVAFLADLDAGPQWLRSASADPQAVFAFGQRMYTAADKHKTIPDAWDRPYAGWAYLIGDLRTRASPTVDHLTMTVGMLGPASGARQTQNNFHHLLHDDEAMGWDTQLRNRPTMMVGYERAWPSVASGRFGDHQVDLSLRASGDVGTPVTFADAGAIVRYGSHLPSDIPVAHITLAPSRDGYRGTPQFGWYGWAGVDARVVGYNSFLQASTFSGGSQVTRKKFGDDIQAGFALAWPRARVGFTMVQRSKEFVGQHGVDRFGQLALSFAF